MNLPFDNKPVRQRRYLLLTGLGIGVILFWCSIGTVWPVWNDQLLDLFYQQAVRYGFSPPQSSQVVELAIDDDTYTYFGKHILDRADLSHLNDVLMSYRPEATAYDLIFARPSQTETDQRFAASIRDPGPVYLPIGVDLNPSERPFIWQEGRAYERLRTEFLDTPHEYGPGQPNYTSRALLQTDLLSDAAFHTGHIGIAPDSDGVYRHLPLLVKLNSQYLPTLALSMFLNHVQVPLREVHVHWGRHLRIPATAESDLERDVVIPIDHRGRVFIPYPDIWQRAFEKMTARALLQHHQNPDLQGNIADFFEGKFVFIGDVSTGAADVGQTPLETRAPLISIHSALLSALLDHTFYTRWPFWLTVGLIGLLTIGFAPTLVFKSPIPLCLAMILYTIGLILFTGFAFSNFSLFPIFTIFISLLFVFLGVLADIFLTAYRDQAFIRDAFTKYVPKSVVNELMLHPERLKLGGEERVISILFSDIEGFTSITERIPPTKLIKLLNEYLAAMTAIILEQGGIVDKFEGDGIMAEFGMPLEHPDHPIAAVRTGLAMQRRLSELGQHWADQGLPALKCRVGINTGAVIVGNMGSDQVFDYTAMGDPVNLASRLESVNKHYGTYLLISEHTYAKLPDDLFHTRLADTVRVQGQSQAVKIYEVYGDASDPISHEAQTYYKCYETAYAAYLARDFATAQADFTEALSHRPGDVAACFLLKRIAELRSGPLPENWDGVVNLTSK